MDIERTNTSESFLGSDPKHNDFYTKYTCTRLKKIMIILKLDEIIGMQCLAAWLAILYI